jgi:hypothetical protein
MKILFWYFRAILLITKISLYVSPPIKNKRIFFIPFPEANFSTSNSILDVSTFASRNLSVEINILGQNNLLISVFR